MITVIEIFMWAGAAVLIAAYVWAFVLAWRVNGAWFMGMLFFGYLLYPFLAYNHWPLMRRNALAFGGGLALLALSVGGIVLLH